VGGQCDTTFKMREGYEGLQAAPIHPSGKGGLEKR
jgi:hypothetical protein